MKITSFSPWIGTLVLTLTSLLNLIDVYLLHVLWELVQVNMVLANRRKHYCMLCFLLLAKKVRDDITYVMSNWLRPCSPIDRKRALVSFGSIMACLQDQPGTQFTMGIYELIIEILWKFSRFNYNFNDQIRLQFCTCHDSIAVLACAKLWPDLMILCQIITP